VAGRYRLVRMLGAGGMGTVWEAQDELLGRVVAIKEVAPPPELTEDEADLLRKRTVREASTAARISHPNVTTVYDVVVADDEPWIVMELVPSRSLSEVIAADGPMSPARVAQIGLDVLAALRTAHAAGVVHRDVKPGNVLLRKSDGRAVLTDFGIATLAGDPSLTNAGLLLGAPAYISPERARGSRGDPSSDLWALGATLYTAVEGRPPHDRGGPLPTLAALVTEDPPPPKNAGDLRPALVGMLRMRPADRLASAAVEAMLRPVAASRAPHNLTVAPRPASPKAAPAAATGPIPEPTGVLPEPPPEPARGRGVRAKLGKPRKQAAPPDRPPLGRPAALPVPAAPAPRRPAAGPPAEVEPLTPKPPAPRAEASGVKPEPASPQPAAATPAPEPTPAAAPEPTPPPAQPDGRPAPRTPAERPALAAALIPITPSHGTPAVGAGPPPDAPGMELPKQRLVAAVVALILVGVIGTVALLTRRDSGPDTSAQGGASTSAPASSPPRSQPSKAPTSAPTSAPPSSKPPAATIGLVPFTSDDVNFGTYSLGFPYKWGWSRGRQSYGGTITFRANDGHLILLLDHAKTAAPDALKDLQAKETGQALGSNPLYPGYHRIRLDHAAEFRPNGADVAVWEFTYVDGGVRMHALFTNFGYPDDRGGYGMLWRGTEAGWSADTGLRQQVFESWVVRHPGGR
jgi:eukaryotic-like serine/threonine-protein kinase